MASGSGHSSRYSSPIPILPRKRKRSSTPSTLTTESDISYLGNLSRLPSAVSHWNRECLEDIGIFYDSTYHESPFEILDRVFNETGNFGPLNKDQKLFANTVKSVALFDLMVDPFSIVQFKDYSNTIMPALEKSLVDCIKKSHTDDLEKRDVLYDARNFLASLTDVISFEVSYHLGLKRNFSECEVGPVPESMYVEVFRNFSKMCGLKAWPGDLLTLKMMINNLHVTSKADFIITPIGTVNPLESSEAVVSIVEITSEMQDLMVKNARDMVTTEFGKRLTRDALKKHCEKRNDSVSNLAADTNESCSSKPVKKHGEKDDTVNRGEVGAITPEISQNFHSKVLGQHGGELLLGHYAYATTLCDKPVKYCPGMIVMGPKVLFTLLEIEGVHVRDLKKPQLNKHEHKAIIYYSKPKNLFKKKDRDVLIESFVRLKNLR